MTTFEEINATWSLVGKIAVGLGVIVALITAVKYLYDMLPSAKLEKRVKDIEDKQKDGFDRLEKIDGEISAIKEDNRNTEKQLTLLNEGITRIGKSQISLLHHFATGNGQSEMMKEADDLTDFFIDR